MKNSLLRYMMINETTDQKDDWTIPSHPEVAQFKVIDSHGQESIAIISKKKAFKFNDAEK